MKSKVSADAVSMANPRSLEDVTRFVDFLNDQIDLVDVKLKVAKKRTSAGLGFEIDQDQIQESPTLKDPASLKIEVEDKKRLTESFALVAELSDSLRTAESMSARVKSLFDVDSPEARRILESLDKVRKRLTSKIQEAGQFIADLANRKAPKEMVKFLEKVNAVLEKSVSYKSSKSFLYAFATEAGNIAFSCYIQLIHAVDEEGSMFPDLFIIVSLDPAVRAYYLDVATDFSLPTDAVFVTKINSIKDFVTSLHSSLLLENFQNDIGAVPLQLLIAPGKLNRLMFNAAGHIKKVTLNEEVGILDFELKPTVQDKETAVEVANQLFEDCQRIVDTAGVSIRTRVDLSREGFHVLVYVVKPTSRSHVDKAMPEDLDPLKDRFNLNEAQVRRILKMVNGSRVNSDITLTVSPIVIVRMIDEAVRDYGANGFMRALETRLRDEIGVPKEKVVLTCDTALRQARYFMKGIQTYAREIAPHGKTVSKENANVYEVALQFIKLAELAARQPESCWRHKMPLDKNGTTRICTPKEQDVGGVVLRIVQNARHQYGAPAETSLGSSDSVKTWTWKVKPVGEPTMVMKIEHDTRPTTQYPIIVRTFHTS